MLRRLLLSPPSPRTVDERLVLGALVRGSLALRDLAGLAPKWWLRGETATDRAFGELHATILDAIEVAPRRRGAVDLALVLHLLAAAGCPAGLVREGHAVGYLPDLARRAPARAVARLALWRMMGAADEAHRLRDGGEQLVRGVGRALAAALRADPVRAQAMVAGVAAELASAR